ncbi:Pyridoxine/pyridoxamine 5'-phosphate oxidase 2 [Leucoagaricus sp. SymC.cos]|nr:Pyridoxine/pyridoxamine 5'-phosphate oxidase 2 [Leucoagaricus sp. SymC.cos]
MSANSVVPRWKKLIDKALEHYPKATTFQLATIDVGSPIPRARSHIFRSFLESPITPGLPLLISSTDVRTPKVHQILNNPNVEAVWWIEGTREQFRFTGRVSMVTSPNDELFNKTRAQLLNNAEVDSEGGLAALKPSEYDWETKRVEVFKKMSAHMKASWCRPTPGSVLEGGPDEAKKWPERVEEPKEGDNEEARKNWTTALGNFALVVVEPSEADYLNMAVVPNRRFQFARAVEGGWDEVEVVP